MAALRHDDDPLRARMVRAQLAQARRAGLRLWGDRYDPKGETMAAIKETREQVLATVSANYPHDHGDDPYAREPDGTLCRYLLVQSRRGEAFWHHGASDVASLFRYQESETNEGGMPWTPLYVVDLNTGDAQRVEMKCEFSAHPASESFPPAGSVAARLEYLRGELRGERISYGELAELQGLAEHIPADDLELREAAGLPEHGDG